MRKKLLEDAGTKGTSSNGDTDLISPEPWFDLNASAPGSMSTQHTKSTKYEKDEPESPDTVIMLG
jgi:hypothetical protein